MADNRKIKHRNWSNFEIKGAKIAVKHVVVHLLPEGSEKPV